MKTFYKFLYAILFLATVNSVTFSAKILPVFKYKQCDSPWGQLQLGNCPGYSICNWGCALACMSMLLKSNGTDADPLKVNSFMNSHNYWSGGCDMDWIKVCWYTGSSMSWNSSPAYSLSTVKNQIDANNPVVVKVLLSGNQDHFIVVKGYNNNGTTESDFIVLDPLETNERTLNLYNKQSLRLFNNVMQSSNVTVAFKFNGNLLPAPPNEWKIWKYPPISSTYYTLTIEVTNRNGNTYDVYVYKSNGDSTDVALNVNQDILTQGFNVHVNTAWFPASGLYKFKVFKRTAPRELWATSQQFYISILPGISVDPIPSVIYVGQSVTITWHITPGISTLPPSYGWINNAQVQLYRDTTALNVLGMPLVNSGSYTFTVPSITGPNMRVSVSNPPNSSIPPGYVFAFSNYTTITNPTAIVPVSQIIPTSYKLYNSYPNPFNPVSKIKFDLPQSGFTNVSIYDALGNNITTLVNEELAAGTYSITFDGSNLATGIYFYQIQSNDFSATQKMILVK